MTQNQGVCLKKREAGGGGAFDKKGGKKIRKKLRTSEKSVSLSPNNLGKKEINWFSSRADQR